MQASDTKELPKRSKTESGMEARVYDAADERSDQC